MPKEEKVPLSRDERIKELLDKPALDAVSSIKGPSLSDLVQEPKVEKTEIIEEEETPQGGKKVRIPASRLKTLTAKIDELEAKLAESSTYAERVTALESKIKDPDEELPQWWIDAYGDTDVSKQGYKNQQRIMREELQRGLQQVETQRHQEEVERAERVEQIEESFDTQMDELEETLGRELTSTQKAELLDIVGEYSPMDGDSYVAYMPISKAYDIWSKGQGSPAKKEMADIAGMQSSGASAPTPSHERPQWGDWRKRLNI